MLGAVASFSTTALCSRELTYDLSVGQVVFLRCLVGLPLIVLIMVALRGPRRGIEAFRTVSVPKQFVRGMLNLTAQFLWVYAISMLPLSTVFAIEFSNPLWATVLAALVLGELPNKYQKIGIVMGFGGVLIIVRPGLQEFNWGLVAQLVSSLGFASTYLVTRVLGRNDDPVAMPFWMCVTQIPVAALLAGLDWHPILWEHAPLIFFLALGGIASHQCISAALALVPVARAMPIDYLRLPVIAVIGAILYGEIIDPFVVLGALIVIGAVTLTQRNVPPKKA